MKVRTKPLIMLCILGIFVSPFTVEPLRSPTVRVLNLAKAFYTDPEEYKDIFARENEDPPKQTVYRPRTHRTLD